MGRLKKYLVIVFLGLILLSGCTLFGKKNGSAEITLLLKDGTPVKNIEIILSQGKKTFSGKTNDKGVVTITSIPVGDHTLNAEIPLFDNTKHSIQKAISIKAEEITKTTIKDEVLSFVTIRAATSTDTPLGFSTVVVESNAKEYSFETNEAGKITLSGKSGKYQAKVKALGEESELQEIVFKGGDSLDVNISFDPVYTQSFATNELPSDFLVVEGSWKVEDNSLVGDSPTTSDQTSIVFGPKMSDFVYSADVTFISAVNSSRWFSLFFHAPDGGKSSYQMFTIRQNAKAANGTELAFRTPSGTWDVKHTKAYSEELAIGKTFNIKIAVTGNTCLYFINDELQMAKKESSYLGRGIFGFHVNGSKVRFDNIVIEPYDKNKYGVYESEAE